MTTAPINDRLGSIEDRNEVVLTFSQIPLEKIFLEGVFEDLVSQFLESFLLWVQRSILHGNRSTVATIVQFLLPLHKSRELYASERGNSCVENFFASIKKELIYRHSWPTESALRAEIEKYINFYNARRRHSSIGNCSPMEYELVAAIDEFKLAA